MGYQFDSNVDRRNQRQQVKEGLKHLKESAAAYETRAEGQRLDTL